MSLSAIERFFSLLALVAGAGAVAIVVLRIVPAGFDQLARHSRLIEGIGRVFRRNVSPSSLVGLAERVRDRSLTILAPIGHASRWLAFGVAATAMAGSLWFSEVEKFTPCKLCWYQRICMYGAAIVLLVGALRRDPKVRWYVVPLAAIGIVVSIYHYLLEWYPQLETSACDISVPCTAIWYREFGFVTLSFSALCGFAAILALMLLTPDDGHLEDPHGEQAISPHITADDLDR